MSVKAPKGRQVSFAKNKQFIRDLRKRGWNVRGISSDTFQNAAVAQDLQHDGFDYQVISVDRVNNTTDKICEPYLFFKNAIYNKRIVLYDTPLLTEELLSLERNNNTGKVDHPVNGSKDAADGIVGALWNASKHQEEYSLEYGESLLNQIPQINKVEADEQINIQKEFEEQLKQQFMPSLNQQQGYYINPEFEKRMKRQRQINNGILVW